MLERLKTVSFKTGTYMVIVVSILSVAITGIFAMVELRARDRMALIAITAASAETEFHRQIEAIASEEGQVAAVADGSRVQMALGRARAMAQHDGLVSPAGVSVSEAIGQAMTRHAGITQHWRTSQDRAAFLAEANGLVGSLRALEQSLFDISRARSKRSGFFLSGLVLVVILVVSSISVMILRQFSVPLQTLILFTRGIGEGNLRSKVDLDIDTELGSLGVTLNEMTASLGLFAKRTRRATADLAATSEQIQDAARRQSLGATDQAAAVSQVTSVLEQLRTTNQGTLREADSLKDRAEAISREGDRGRESVEQAIQSMAEIHTRMNRISEIISTLDGHTAQIGEITSAVRNLARQSNMLALNAAIEAAKAGEAGAGFAVVAAEVRHLSEQSEQATQQVALILEEIREAAQDAVNATLEGTLKVQEGNQMVEESGNAVRHLTGLIHETARVSQRIVGSMTEEAKGIGQAADAMADIRRVIQEFVDTTVDNEQSAENLRELAAQIQRTVAAYKIV